MVVFFFVFVIVLGWSGVSSWLVIVKCSSLIIILLFLLSVLVNRVPLHWRHTTWVLNISSIHKILRKDMLPNCETMIRSLLSQSSHYTSMTCLLQPRKKLRSHVTNIYVSGEHLSISPSSHRPSCLLSPMKLTRSVPKSTSRAAGSVKVRGLDSRRWALGASRSCIQNTKTGFPLTQITACTFATETIFTRGVLKKKLAIAEIKLLYQCSARRTIGIKKTWRWCNLALWKCSPVCYGTQVKAASR